VSGRALVTGGTGFLGARLVRKLVERGEDVKILARPTSSHRGLSGVSPSRIEVVEGDVTIGHTVFRALAGCDRLYHVASEFRLWDRDRSRIYDAAVVGTRETLEAAKSRGIEKIVVTSSTAAVGASTTETVLDESSSLDRPDAETYVVAKRRAEQIALEMAAQGLNVVVVNPATLFGPGDYKPTPSGRAIVDYFGYPLPFDIPTPPGGFNVVDVDDVAEGHILAMERGRAGQRYILAGDNVTFGQMFSVLSELTGLAGPGWQMPAALVRTSARLLELQAGITGRAPAITYKMARDYVGHYVWVSSAKAERELGFTHRDLRSTLARAVSFFLDEGFVPEPVARRVRAVRPFAV
jgi:dihydroflavonol-4-reductase